ncbi:uncharacterized protein LOC117574773 [Drosophila albomicans]|uniref:Uncharacterized protein LOC117574773 n=1 Tax=Drosophila albomicans TaxID=7291 RepID=A0A6P8ZCZ3_DROAB|nr:uncharacterized protein LOC117574773 [Drosophila albomicans]
MNFALISYGILLYFLCFSARNDAIRNWDHEFLYIESTSSNEELVNASIKLEHTEIGKNSVSGFIDWKFDADEHTMCQLRFLWSQSGRDNDYKDTIHQVPMMTFYEFLDKYYMKIVYADWGSCTNLPDIGSKFVPPWNKTTYIFSKCDPPGVNFPDILPRGYHKLVCKIIGQAELVIETILKLTPRKNMLV